jgi:uncharacterized protein
MRVVLDTNVLLSALISPYGAPDRIYKAWREARFSLVTSTAQLDELRRVSRYPKLKAILPPHRIGAMVNNLHSAIVLERLEALPGNVTLSDPNDAFVYVMAWQGDADFLVTGDQSAGLLQCGNAGRARIVTPSMFCTEVLKHGE